RPRPPPFSLRSSSRRQHPHQPQGQRERPLRSINERRSRNSFPRLRLVAAGHPGGHLHPRCDRDLLRHARQLACRHAHEAAALAGFFAEVSSEELSLRDLIKAGMLVGLPLVLILKQPDLGTALVLVPLLAVGAFLAGLQWQHAAVFSLAGILLIGAVFYPPVSRRILKPYQRERITSFLHPEEDAKGSGYQLLQSKIAVGSGGFWGKGFSHGSQNQLGYIPVRYSDFIMSAWAEEQGFKGVLL